MNDIIWKMPEEGSEIKFKSFKKQGYAPFVIYADFEAYLQTLIHDDEHLQAAAAQPATIQSTLHKPIAIGALLVAAKPMFSLPEYPGLLQRSIYYKSVGRNAAQDFLHKASGMGRALSRRNDA